MKKFNNLFINIIIVCLVVGIIYFSYGIFYEIKSNKINNEIKSEMKTNASIKKETSYNIGGYDESKFPSETIVKTKWGEDEPIIFTPKDIEPSNFLYADFKELKKQNEDTIAWLWIPGTEINYSVLQAKDNDYYLTHNFKKEKNDAGWIYGDYRSSFDNLGRNSVIYGHNQIDSSMFGDLKKLRKEKDWFKDNENKFIYLATENASYVFKIFSIYETKPNRMYIQHGMENNIEYQAFLSAIMEKNEVLDVSDSVNTLDKILTLSTCTNRGEGRLAIHAKLVKYKTVN